ncbi:MAG: hypothetical protein Q4B45_01180 [Coriobacteriia bacterium]|nr:hypothetical protein [Coriobacteriia bacterium]
MENIDKKYAMLIPLVLVLGAFFAPDAVNLLYPYKANLRSTQLSDFSTIAYHVLKSIGLMGCLYYGAWRTLEWAKGIDEKGADEK